MTSFFVNTIGLLLIAFIAYWFLFYKVAAKKVESNAVDILVQDGVYEPSVIKAPLDQPLHLRFYRKDKTPCAAVVVFDDFDISAELPVNKPHSITLKPSEPGEYKFTCQMGMYQGKLIVE